MFVCKECGKKFKEWRALGGHVASAHRQQTAVTSIDTGRPAESQSQPANTQEHSDLQPQAEAPQGQVTEEGEERGIMEHVRELLRDGYTAKQIQEKWGYRRQTIGRVFRENIVPEGKPVETEHEHYVNGLPVVVKGSEVITPESIMARLVNGSNDWERRLEGMMLLRAAQRMNRDDIDMMRMQAEADAARIKPILELMKETRLDQDAAAQRAKESNVEIANRAADETAGQLGEVFREHTTRMNDSINQIRQAMGGKEEKSPLGQLLSTMQEMTQLMQMFGMPGMPGQQSPQGGDQGWQPPPIRRRSKHSEGGINVRPDAEDVSEPPGS